MSAIVHVQSRSVPASWRLTRVWGFLIALLLLAGRDFSAFADSGSAGLSYTNCQVPEVPWSIHIVRVERTNSLYELHTQHAGGRAVGLSTLSSQVALINPALGVPVAAVNGDFYQRDRAYAGDPRGLQILDGELISAPAGGVCFWVDALGEPHATNVFSQFQVTWPDGSMSPFGLNEERRPDAVVLYTPTLGGSTRTIGGRELVLEAQPGSAWLPLRIGRNISARVREVRESGNTSLEPSNMVLSIGPAQAFKTKSIAAGAVLQLSTASVPALRGIHTGIGGGPILVRGGQRQRIRAANAESYIFSSMKERHPRAAVGWDDEAFYLVEVDGRQRDLSVGMTLDELGAYMARLGCTDAMTLDGGGSATLWFKGSVRNSPCDGYERNLANSLVVVRKKPKLGNAQEAAEKN